MYSPRRCIVVALHISHFFKIKPSSKEMGVRANVTASRVTTFVNMGFQSAASNQATTAVAIGAYAGQTDQGANCVAIGAYAGQTSQAANSIVINASGGAVNSSTSGFFVRPVRSGTGGLLMGYDPTTSEIFQSAAGVVLANGTSTANITASAGANVSVTLPWVSANVIPSNPIVANLTLDATVLAASLTNSANVTSWGGATGLAVGNGSYPAFKEFSSEPADQYVAFPGNTITADATNGSYLNFGTTTWNVATNGGFTYVGYVNFNAITSYERLFDFGSGAASNNIYMSREGTTANLRISIHQVATEYSISTTAPVMSTGGSNWQVVAGRVLNTGTNAWNLSMWVNGANVRSNTWTSTVLSDRTVTNSYVGRSNWGDPYGSFSIREALFYNRALSDAEMGVITAYLTSKYSTLYYVNPVERSLSVLGNNASTSLKITTNGDLSLRSVNGLVIKNPRGWNAPNHMRFDILKYLQASRDSCCIMPGLDGVRTGGGTYPGSGAYWSSVLLPDGRVYCVPSFATTARIYDPITDTLTTPTGTFAGGGAFYTGVLLNDGRVFLIPRISTTARIYDPSSDTLTTPSGTYAGLDAFLSGVLLNDGRVFMIPAQSTTARIYDPAADSLSTPSGTYPGNYFSVSGTLLPDGRVFMVPNGSTTARIYDPVTDIVTTTASGFPSGGQFQSGVLLPDGRVYCVPFSATSTARMYDPVNDVVTTPSGVFSTAASSFAAGCLLPDGRVFISPCNNTTARIYDPVKDVLTTPRGTYPGSNAFSGCVLLPDGRVFMTPLNSTTSRIAFCGGWGSVRLPLSVLTSPFLNKL